jgi:hypothetical protein
VRRIKDLPGWPPTHFSGAGPTEAGEVTIKDVLRITKDQVEFSCTVKGVERTCHFSMPDLNTAEQVAEILKKHTGKNLLAIADEPIPETGTLEAEAEVRGHPYP